MSSVINALKYLPASLGLKALEKVNPKFKNYFSEAASYGIDATRALNYLSERFDNPSNTAFKGELEKGEAQGTLRPDERTAKQMIGNSELPGKVVRGAAGLALGGSLTGRQKSNAQSEAQSQDKPLSSTSPRNIIEEHSSELADFLENSIQQGMSPLQAASKAYLDPKFKSSIRAIEKKTVDTFPSIVSSLYQYAHGPQQQSPSSSQQSNASPSAGKQQFLAGLQQLNQSLQAMSKRP